MGQPIPFEINHYLNALTLGVARCVNDLLFPFLRAHKSIDNDGKTLQGRF